MAGGTNARSYSMHRSMSSLLQERSLPTQTQVEETEVSSVQPDVAIATIGQSRFGNEVMADALTGGAFSPLAQLVLSDAALSTVGVGSGSGLLGGSNAAMADTVARFSSEEEESSGSGHAVGSVNQAMQRGGRALPDGIRERLESAFGVSLASVRVHDDSMANEAADAVRSHAFTVGTHIYFNRGALNPGTTKGDELIAHEVTHVVQHLEGREGRATAMEDGVAVTRPTDAVEVEAYAAGAAFARGELAPEPTTVTSAETVEPALDAAPVGEGSAVGTETSQESAPAADGVAARQTAPQSSTTATSQDPSLTQREPGREPTPEELAQLDNANTKVDQGTSQPVTQTQTPTPTPPLPETGTGNAATEANPPEGQQQIEGPALETPVSTQDSGGTGGPGPMPPIEAYMNEHGPQHNEQAGGAGQLASDIWGFTTDTFGPLVGYDRKNGGFGVSNIMGIGRQWNALKDVWNQDRGTGALATVIETVDVVRVVAESVGSIASNVSLACGVLSLIGLIPPLAPVGAALLSAAAVASEVSFISNIVAFALSTVVSILSAIQLVQAVKDNAPNVLQLYENYQQDTANLLANGLSVGIDLIFKRIEAKMPRASGVAPSAKFRDKGKYFTYKTKGFHNLRRGMSEVDGRTARKNLADGLENLGQGKSGKLRQQRGSTRDNLTSQLRRNVARGIAEKYGLSAAKKVTKDSLKKAVKVGHHDQAHLRESQRAHNERARNLAMNRVIAAASAASAVSRPTGISGRLVQAIPQPRTPQRQERQAPELPTPEHAPQELDEIEAQKAALDEARTHIADVRNEANSARSAAEELQTQAEQYEQAATLVDTQVSEGDTQLQQDMQDAQTGEQKATEGMTQTQDVSRQGAQTRDSAQNSQGQLTSTEMPAQPEGGSIWDRIANWFIEKVFRAVSRAFEAVRQFIADMILKAVAWVMGVDDITGKLQQLQQGMQQAGQTTQQSMAVNEQQRTNAQTMHTDAATATETATSTIDQANQDVATADQQEQQLQSQYDALTSAQEEIGQYTTQYAEQWGPVLEGETEEEEEEPQLVGTEVTGQFTSEANGVVTWISAETDALNNLMNDARGAMAEDAEGLGLDANTVLEVAFTPLNGEFNDFRSRMNSRAQALRGTASTVAPYAEMEVIDAQEGLTALASEIESISEEAGRDAASVRSDIVSWLAGAAESMVAAASEQDNAAINRKARGEVDRNQSVSVPDSAGRPLPVPISERYASALGDLSGVRIHTDSTAAGFADSIGARAATVGQDIFFAAGAFSPGTAEGQNLLSHELAHTVQQSNKPGISQPGDATEKAAENFARDFAAGATIPMLDRNQTPSGAIQRKEDEEASTADGEGTEEDPGANVDVNQLLDEGFSNADAGRGDKPNNDGQPVVDPKEKINQPSPTGDKSELALPDGKTTQGDNKNAAAPNVTAEGKKSTPDATPKKENVQAPAVASVQGNGAVQEAFAKVQAGGEAQKGAIDAAGQAEIQKVQAEGQAQKGAIEQAVAALKQQVTADFQRLRQAIQQKGETTKQAIGQQRDAQKQAITQAADAQIQAMKQAVEDRKAKMTQLGQTLAQNARALGQSEALRATQQTQAKAQQAVQIGEQKAGQYAGFEEAKEIAATARKMARETGEEIIKQGAEIATQVTQDGEALAKKCEQDAAEYLKNLGEGIEPAEQAITEAKDKSLTAVDDNYTQAVEQVDKAVTDSISGLDSGEQAALAQVETLSASILPAVDTAVKSAVESVQAGVDRAKAEIDKALAEAAASVGKVHPTRAKEALALLTQMEASIAETGAAAVGGIQQIGAQTTQSVTEAGAQAAQGISTSGEEIIKQNADVETKFGESMSQIEQSTGQAFTQCGTDAGTKMKEAADGFITKLDEAYNEGDQKLNENYNKGKDEITKKVNDCVAKFDEAISKLGSEIDKKADEIENASWWDKLCTAVSSFFKGFFSQLWGWIKDTLKILLIIALVIVVLVVLAVVLVAIFPSLLGPLLAGLIFLAVWGPTILAVAGYIGLAIGVITFAISAYKTWKVWNDPNMTWEEKWEQTGRLGFDLIDLIGPEKLLKPLAGVFKSTKGLDELSDAAKLDDAAHLDDVAKLDNAGHLDDVAKVDNAGHLDDAKKVDVENPLRDASKAETAATHVDDAKKVDGADDVKKVAQGDDVKKVENGSDVNKVDDAQDVQKADDVRKSEHGDDAKKLDEADNVSQEKKVNPDADRHGPDKTTKGKENDGLDNGKRDGDTGKRDPDGSKRDPEKEGSTSNDKKTDVESGGKVSNDRGPSGKRWDDPNMTKDEFIADYKSRFPKSSLSDAELAKRFDEGKRLNPETGRLKTPDWAQQTKMPNKADLSNEDIRAWYNKEVSRIPELNETWKAQGLTAEERARRASTIRHEARMKARERMGNADEVNQLQSRDLEKYGNPDGPNFDQSLKRAQEKGFKGDEAYEEIVRTSSKTDEATNAKFAKGKKGEGNVDTPNPKPQTERPANNTDGKTSKAADTDGANAKTGPNDTKGPSGKEWNDPKLTLDDFKADYRAKYPESKMKDADLERLYDHGMRMDPKTGRMQKVGEAKPKVGVEDAALPKTVDVPKSPNNAEDVLGKHVDELKGDPAAQKRLFEATQETNRKMQQAADEIAAELGVPAPTTGIKGNKPGAAQLDQDRFIAGVVEKNNRNNYKSVGEMKDMTRARFDLDGAEQVDAASKMLFERFAKQFGTDNVVWKKPKGDYPRHHIIVKDPATGIAHEWQIGAKATTDFIEGMHVKLPPGVELHAKPDFHVVKYDVLDKLNDVEFLKKNGLPEDLAQRVGLEKFDEEYNALFRETGKTSKAEPFPKDFKQRQQALADKMAEMLAKLEAESPGSVQRLDTKLQAHAQGPTKGTVNVDTPNTKVTQVDAPETQRPKGGDDVSDASKTGPEVNDATKPAKEASDTKVTDTDGEIRTAKSMAQRIGDSLEQAATKEDDIGLALDIIGLKDLVEAPQQLIKDIQHAYDWINGKFESERAPFKSKEEAEAYVQKKLAEHLQQLKKSNPDAYARLKKKLGFEDPK